MAGQMTESHEDSVDRAFDEGFATFEDDKPRRVNPYDAEDFEAHADAWDDGWFEARSQAQDYSGFSYGDDF